MSDTVKPGARSKRVRGRQAEGGGAGLDAGSSSDPLAP
jgi:hypothetical protein